QRLLARDEQLVVGGGLLDVLEHGLDLRRVDVHTPDDQHVVGALADHADARVRPAAGADLARERGEVTRPEAHQRQRLLGEGGDDEHALLAVGQRLRGLWIEDLRVEMVFPDVAAVALADALVGHTGADDLGEAVDVGGLDAETSLDVAADGLGPRFGAEDAEAQAELVWLDAAPGELLGQRLAVRRGAGDDVWLQVEHQRRLAFGHAARDRHDTQPELLRPAVKAEAAREETVAVRVVEQHARFGPRRREAAGVDLSEELEVVARVPHDSGLARGAGRRVYPGQPFRAHREQAQRVVLVELSLVGDGQARDVVYRPHRRGVDAGLVERFAVVRHALVDVVS